MSKKTEQRKTLNIKIDKLPQTEKVNKWLDSQANITDSISNLILHMIETHGYRDILDFDIQRKLYLSQLNKMELSEIPLTTKHTEVETITENPIENIETIDTNKKEVESVDEIKTTGSTPKEETKPNNNITSNKENNDDDDDDFPSANEL
uniref:Uncharacterized protein n=2 Tax=Aeromonas sp. Ne-1 TaxID=1675689 RepID=A0A0H4JMZ3_9GAMM|nr:hypothetical protein [Aeromonas sp. Ne-1]